MVSHNWHGLILLIMLLTFKTTLVNAATAEELQIKFQNMQQTIHAINRQLLMQQFYLDEKVRSDADSGVKQVRYAREGTRNYYTASHSSVATALAMHDHSNNDRTVGIGEFVAVLNGVEFRTRHNDYRLYMPHKTSSKLHENQEIPFPEVPPEVTSKTSVDEQVKEMREWFKAWSEQNYKVRDYRKYFKPVLCYLEGAWSTRTKGKIDEPFESDRHFVDASSWFDLQEKIRFTSYSGRKDSLENYAYLPTAIMNITDDGRPVFAQWNYRISCHPLSRDLPLNRLRVVEEIGLRMSGQRTYQEHGKTRAARFQVNPFDTDEWKDRVNRERWSFLDDLMGEIPGLDNYQGQLTDEAFDLTAFTTDPKNLGKPLRADRYHRWFKVAKADAMGSSHRHRGFADEALFMALNSQPDIAGMDLNYCTKEGKSPEVCQTMSQKWSYAIPLEVIFLTPLSTWNPYDIQYKGWAGSDDGKTVEADGRNGEATVAKAYDGTNSKKYYITPASFFSGNEIGAGSADTTKNSVGVLDRKGKLRICKASGTRILFPLIKDVGLLRQRWPIFPVHGEGSAVWKELDALKDLIIKSKTNSYYFQEPLAAGGQAAVSTPEKDTRMQITISTSSSTSIHTHEIFFTASQIKLMLDGATVSVTSSQSNSHTHSVLVGWGKSAKRWIIRKCDDGKKDEGGLRCWDKHSAYLVVLPDE